MLEDTILTNMEAPPFYTIWGFLAHQSIPVAFRELLTERRQQIYLSFRIKSGLRPLISEVTSHKEELEAVQVGFILIQREYRWGDS